MEHGLVGLAFTAGLVAALNPCGFALLPAYLSLVVRGEGTGGPLPAVARALAASAAMALGFLAVFSAFGLLAVSVASAVQRYIPFVTVLIGIALVALGAWLLAGRKLAVLIPFSGSSRWTPTARIGSMFAYGVGYALASLSCTIGPFLAVTGVSLRRGAIVDSLWVYLAYGAGMALIVGVLATAVAVAGSALVGPFRRIVPYVNRIGGALVVLVGMYVTHYGIYEVRLFYANGNPSDGVIAAAGRLQGTLAAWVHQHGAGPWLLAVGVLLALATLGSLWRRQARQRARASHQRARASRDRAATTPVHPHRPPEATTGTGAQPRSGSHE